MRGPIVSKYISLIYISVLWITLGFWWDQRSEIRFRCKIFEWLATGFECVVIVVLHSFYFYLKLLYFFDLKYLQTRAGSRTLFQQIIWTSFWQKLLIKLYSFGKFFWISFVLCQFIGDSIHSRLFQLVPGDSSSFQVVPGSSSFYLVCTLSWLVRLIWNWFLLTNFSIIW